VVYIELDQEIAFQNLEHLVTVNAKNDVAVFFFEHLHVGSENLKQKIFPFLLWKLEDYFF